MIATAPAIRLSLREAKAAAAAAQRRLDAANAAYEASSLYLKAREAWDQADRSEFEVWDQLLAGLCGEHCRARDRVRQVVRSIRRAERLVVA
jgi:hypothetical protein